MGDLSRDGSVGSLDWKGEDADEEIQSGSIYLFKWLADTWADGGGKHVVIQFLTFYALMLVGFLFLWGMMRSTAKLRELRRHIAETMREQRNRKFDVDTYYSTMAGGGYF